jgi:hypothetical protein
VTKPPSSADATPPRRANPQPRTAEDQPIKIELSFTALDQDPEPGDPGVGPVLPESERAPAVQSAQHVDCAAYLGLAIQTLGELRLAQAAGQAPLQLIPSMQDYYRQKGYTH